MLHVNLEIGPAVIAEELAKSICWMTIKNREDTIALQFSGDWHEQASHTTNGRTFVSGFVTGNLRSFCPALLNADERAQVFPYLRLIGGGGDA
jgi:hypothetical protein